MCKAQLCQNSLSDSSGKKTVAQHGLQKLKMVKKSFVTAEKTLRQHFFTSSVRSDLSLRFLRAVPCEMKRHLQCGKLHRSKVIISMSSKVHI